jgi:hypothetical protein
MKQEGHWGKFKSLKGDLIRDINNLAATEDRIEYRHLANDLSVMQTLSDTAVNFYMPNANDVLLHSEFTEEVQLPYPTIALLAESRILVPPQEGDYSTPLPATGWRITLAHQPQQSGPIIIYVCVQRPDTGEWDLQTVATRLTFDHEIKSYMVSLLQTPSYRYVMDSAAKLNGIPVEQIQQEILTSRNQAARGIFTLCTMLGVHNTKTIKVCRPPKLAKKDARRGENGLFDYHVLSVGGEVWDSPHEHTGTGEGRRSHLRRGHVRKLKTQSVWVRSTYVHGSKEGFVKKDYEVKGTSNAVRE